MWHDGEMELWKNPGIRIFDTDALISQARHHNTYTVGRASNNLGFVLKVRPKFLKPIKSGIKKLLQICEGFEAGDMYNGTGLQTPRGSSTNGYTQSNKLFVKPETKKVLTNSNKGLESGQGTTSVTRTPNKEILEQDRKRQTEVRLLVLEEMLIDQGNTAAEIMKKLEVAKKSLEAKDDYVDRAGGRYDSDA